MYRPPTEPQNCYNTSMQFERITIFYNEQKPQNKPFAQDVATWLSSGGRTATVVTSLEDLSDTNLLICMGGDGALLACAREAAPKRIPVLGINCGTLGFLAACEKEEFQTTLTDLFENKLLLQHRLMLAVQVKLPHEETQDLIALNDCVLHADKTRALTVEATFNGHPLPSYFGDGVLISTPTGSTAYALAAGGPIVAPGVEGILVTPICPHTLTQRPILLPAEGQLALTPVLKTPLDGADLTIDGQETLPLPPGSHVQITQSPFAALLFTSPKRDFFTMLNRKFSWGSR